MTERTLTELEAGLERVLEAPTERGTLRLIVARTAIDERQILQRGTLTEEHGLEGDNWLTRGNKRTPDGSAHPLKQITIINARVLELIAGEPENWAAAGDQLYADFNVRETNTPAGTRLVVGNATLEVTDAPHLGCAKFKDRYGHDALRWVNSEAGVKLKLRGVNARVIKSGTIRIGDPISKA